ncbi:hypothetical protein, partial [Klebsiella oxytoca]|uniref:hypothetical protein n=1 Tax=Klebsiella oxytoca TaxID=571 RepID=UPI0028F82DBB
HGNICGGEPVMGKAIKSVWKYRGQSIALYTVTIRMGEKATFFSLPVSGFADVVEVVVLWFSSGLYSSFWG